MIISGSVENIIYRNEENGYSVIELDYKGTPVTCVGNFPIISEGQIIEAEGDYKIGKYGEQFCCSILKYHTPQSKEAITRYLASGLIKGVGEVTASYIVDKFGKDTLDIIENCPSKLAQVKGISLKKAGEIGASVCRLKDIQSAVMFLQKYNITVNTALKIYKVYSDETENVLKENPYKLIEDIEGIGFLTADKIATNLGIKKHSEFRIRAGLIYILKYNAETIGSTYYPKDEIINNLSKLLEIDFENEEYSKKLDSIIDNLTIDGLIKTIDYKEKSNLMLSMYYNIEKSISQRLIKLLNNLPLQVEDLDFFIQEYEKLNSIKLHKTQKDAVKNAVQTGVCVITGGPGTGKTTIIKCILYILKQSGNNAVLCAPTGRAAKRLAESTGQEAKTIHRLLDLSFKTNGYFTYNENTSLTADTVIVDEVSMVDEFLFNSLIKAIKQGAKLILVGDKDQLPSVGAGNVLSNIISSNCIDVQMLTEIYRQEKESLIVLNAHDINNGKFPQLDNNSSDFFFIEKHNAQEMLDTVTELCLNRLPAYLKTAPETIQVLAPMKKGACGVNNINKNLQKLINPPCKDKKEAFCDNVVFRNGDKVMQTVNNYNLKWTKNSIPFESGEGVFNGDIGFIININNSYELTVEFEDGRVADYSAADINDLTLAYAISVHKSQGCEFDAVVLPIVGGPPTLLTRNLLYTAITRAKKLVVLVGTKYMIEKMVKNNYTLQRYSFLADFIKKQYNNFKGLIDNDS